jgi:hypothetical protein
MRDPDWRRYGRNLLLGKFLGLALLPVAILGLQLVVHGGVAHQDLEMAKARASAAE